MPDDWGPPIRPNPRVARKKPTPLPLLPMLAASLFLLALFQLASAWWLGRFETPRGALERALASAPSAPSAVAPRVRPAAATANRWAGDGPRRVVMPALPTNLQFGNPTAKVVVTILTDPSCGLCREQLRTWLEPAPRSIRLVYKYWPAQPGRLTPGMLVELARRNGVTAAFWQALDNAEGDLSDAQMLALLETAGVPLAKQRAALSDQTTNPLGSALAQDIEQARSLGLPSPPLMLVNGYVIDGIALRPELLADYVAKLEANEPLAPRSDIWLMEK